MKGRWGSWPAFPAALLLLYGFKHISEVEPQTSEEAALLPRPSLSAWAPA